MLNAFLDTRKIEIVENKSPVFMVTWLGGGDGEIQIVDLEYLRSEDAKGIWDLDNPNFYDNPLFTTRLEHLGFGESLVFNNVTQLVSFTRMSDAAPYKEE